MANEIQRVTYIPWGGDSYTLDSEPVVNNTTADLETALDTLFGSGNTSVTETITDQEWEVEFTGALANTNVAQMTPDAHATVTTLVEGSTPSSAGMDNPRMLRGAAIVLTGTGFTGAISVTFNGVSAEFTVDSDTQITAIVPRTGNVNGTIVITLADTVTEVETDEPFELLPVTGGWHLAV